MMHRNWRHDWRVLLGLFALVLQLFAGFAHHHDAGAAGIQHAYQASLADNAGVLPLAYPDGHAAEHEHGSPNNNYEHDGDDEHACGICLALAALRTAHLPDAIAVSQPSCAAMSACPVQTSTAPPEHTWRANRARAPPSGLNA